MKVSAVGLEGLQLYVANIEEDLARWGRGGSGVFLWLLGWCQRAKRAEIQSGFPMPMGP